MCGMCNVYNRVTKLRKQRKLEGRFYFDDYQNKHNYALTNNTV